MLLFGGRRGFRVIRAGTRGQETGTYRRRQRLDRLECRSVWIVTVRAQEVTLGAIPVAPAPSVNSLAPITEDRPVTLAAELVRFVEPDQRAVGQAQVIPVVRVVTIEAPSIRGPVIDLDLLVHHQFTRFRVDVEVVQVVVVDVAASAGPERQHVTFGERLADHGDVGAGQVGRAASRAYEQRRSEGAEVIRMQSVDQLTDLVGKVPLKELVRQSTDLVEKLCIEAALELTGDNRASAAELLGVSRQGLYAKLHRYKLAEKGAED